MANGSNGHRAAISMWTIIAGGFAFGVAAVTMYFLFATFGLSMANRTMIVEQAGQIQQLRDRIESDRRIDRMLPAPDGQH